MAQSIEQISFELTANALAEQERALSDLRARAGILLAAASVAGSFLGAKISRDSFDAWSVLAMVSFLSCVGSAIWVLLPHELVFAFRGEAILAESDGRDMQDAAEAYRTAGIWAEPHLNANRDKIGELSDWLAVSCVMLAAEIVFWTLNLLC
ncbi:MAG TPA: hypothetical protein VGX16_02415 [Solirubrobacteraceae bacterium]|jgi:hypothetical protein|nr:hypothetical protein [Solirubrobacteraceae bacterium]